MKRCDLPITIVCRHEENQTKQTTVQNTAVFIFFMSNVLYHKLIHSRRNFTNLILLVVFVYHTKTTLAFENNKQINN